jgi:hypothetical protein
MVSGGAAGGGLDEVGTTGSAGMLRANVPAPAPQPTAKVRITAPPNGAIALAAKFMKCPFSIRPPIPVNRVHNPDSMPAGDRTVCVAGSKMDQ